MEKLTLVKNPEKSSLDNSGVKLTGKMTKLDLIKAADPFQKLFPIRESVLRAIADDIKKNGYDGSQPIHVWKEKGVILDGHTRVEAARTAELFQVPVFEHSFEDENEALEYAIHMQRDRRNLTDAELYACILELDKRSSHGGKRVKGSGGPLKDLKHQTAEVTGTSANKVQKVRTISDHASKELKEAVRSGKVSINKAYNETQRRRETALKPKIKEKNPTVSYRIRDELIGKKRLTVELSKTPSKREATRILCGVKQRLDELMARESSA